MAITSKGRLLQWAIFGAASAGTLAYLSYRNKSKHIITNSLNMFKLNTRPTIKPTRQVVGSNVLPDYQLTLFQFNNCPFSRKVRVFLDYYSLEYDVVEVSPFSRSQLSFSPVRSVPVLLASHSSGPSQLLVDSSAIISVLKSCAVREQDSLDKVASLYEVQLTNPVLDSNGNLVKAGSKPNILNKYFLMYGDTTPAESDNALLEEHQWRQWVDDTLVHLIAPNIYRSPVEAYSSLAYFRQALGENSMVKVALSYPASVVMYSLGRLIKHRHHIEGNEREALHKALAHWTRAVGKSRSYMGGTSPNLSDLAVFGVLNSIEGCQAFKEVVAKNMELKSWYQRMQDLVENQAGLYSLPQTFHKKTPN